MQFHTNVPNPSLEGNCGVPSWEGIIGVGFQRINFVIFHNFLGSPLYLRIPSCVGMTKGVFEIFKRQAERYLDIPSLKPIGLISKCSKKCFSLQLLPSSNIMI